MNFAKSSEFYSLSKVDRSCIFEQFQSRAVLVALVYGRLWRLEFVFDVIFDPLFSFLRFVGEHQVSLVILLASILISTVIMSQTSVESNLESSVNSFEIDLIRHFPHTSFFIIGFIVPRPFFSDQLDIISLLHLSQPAPMFENRTLPQ